MERQRNQYIIRRGLRWHAAGARRITRTNTEERRKGRVTEEERSASRRARRAEGEDGGMWAAKLTGMVNIAVFAAF
jgi:hypothetical protein